MACKYIVRHLKCSTFSSQMTDSLEDWVCVYLWTATTKVYSRSRVKKEKPFKCHHLVDFLQCPLVWPPLAFPFVKFIGYTPFLSSHFYLFVVFLFSESASTSCFSGSPQPEGLSDYRNSRATWSGFMTLRDILMLPLPVIVKYGTISDTSLRGGLRRLSCANFVVKQ